MVSTPFWGPSNRGNVWVATKRSIRPSFQLMCWAVHSCDRSNVHSASVLAVSRWNGSNGRRRAGTGPRLGEDSREAAGVVVETAHTFVGAEVMVERAVLVHEEHHVFDRTEIGPAGGTDTGGLGGGLPQAASARLKAPDMPATRISAGSAGAVPGAATAETSGLLTSGRRT